MNAEDFGLNPETARVEEGLDYRVIMPKLVTAGFAIWTPADIMDARNAAVGKPGQNKVWEAYVDTSFGIAGTKEAVYLDPHSSRLQAITVSNGAPHLSDANRAGMRGYQRSDLILDRDLSEKEAREHPLWLAFADGDQRRLNTYVENTSRLGKDKYRHDTMMGVHVPDDGILRVLVLHGLYETSRAGGITISDYIVRLVGVRRNTTPDSGLVERV